MGDAQTAGRKKVKGKRTHKQAKITSKEVSALKSLVKANKTNVQRFDAELVNQTISAGGACYTLCKGITVGSNLGQRSGNVIRLKSFYARILLQTTSVTTGAQNCQVRVMIFQDRGNMGVLPTTTDLLIGLGGANPCLAPINQFNVSKYIILYDQVVLLGPYPNQPVQWADKIYIDKNLIKEVTFAGTTGTDADSRSNHLYFYIVMNTGGAVAPVYDMTYRITFTE